MSARPRQPRASSISSDIEGQRLMQAQTYIGHVLVSVNPFRDCT
jgi:myosin heavy subunit